MKPGDLQPYLDHVRHLPFVVSASIEAPRRAGRDEVDAVLRLKTPAGVRRLLVEHKASPLNRARAEHLLTRFKPAADWLLLAPYVTPTLAARLAAAGVNFVDLAGNLRVAVGRQFLGSVEGRKPAPRLRERGPGVAGAHVLLALAIRPELLRGNVRELGRAAGVGKTAAAAALHDLERSGVLVRAPRGLALVPGRVLDAFLGLYEERLRPKMLIGRYATQERDPAVLEARLEPLLEANGAPWAWGGAAAAYRWAPHHRGERTVLHVDDATPALATALRLVPKRDGEVILLRSPGPAVFEASPSRHIVPPILAYAEMLATADDRTREAAEVLRETHLGAFR